MFAQLHEYTKIMKLYSLENTMGTYHIYGWENSTFDYIQKEVRTHGSSGTMTEAAHRALVPGRCSWSKTWLIRQWVALKSAALIKEGLNNYLPGKNVFSQIHSFIYLPIHMKSSRICQPKICHFGTLIFLSWRQLRRSSYKKGILPAPTTPFAQNQDTNLKKCPPTTLPHQEGWKSITEDNSRTSSA